MIRSILQKSARKNRYLLFTSHKTETFSLWHFTLTVLHLKKLQHETTTWEKALLHRGLTVNQDGSMWTFTHLQGTLSQKHFTLLSASSCIWHQAADCFHFSSSIIDWFFESGCARPIFSGPPGVLCAVPNLYLEALSEPHRFQCYYASICGMLVRYTMFLHRVLAWFAGIVLFWSSKSHYFAKKAIESNQPTKFKSAFIHFTLIYKKFEIRLFL